ncbi:gap junction delta-4 protein [Thomomys bottae]
MENLDLMGFLIITLNCNVTIVGKIWLIFTLLVRVLAVVLAGYPVYQDEQERFVCNTLQPGCANVCYDAFSPVSPLRFWLVQTVAVLLPYAVFSAYAVHRGARLAALEARGPHACAEGLASAQPPGADPDCAGAGGAGRLRVAPDFSWAYRAHVFLRTLLEAASGALHYLLFGFSVPERFSCTHPPCSSAVDCYVSRPTEKSVLMLFIWAVSALSFLLGVVDLTCCLRRRRAGRPGPGSRGGSPGKERPAPAAPGPARGLGPSPSGMDEDRGWVDGAGVRPAPGEWGRGQGARGPGDAGLPEEDQSRATSSPARGPMAVADPRPRGGPQGQASQDPRSWAGSGEQPLGSRARLDGPSSSPPRQPPGRLAAAGSAPHLRTQKSEWV